LIKKAPLFRKRGENFSSFQEEKLGSLKTGDGVVKTINDNPGKINPSVLISWNVLTN